MNYNYWYSRRWNPTPNVNLKKKGGSLKDQNAKKVMIFDEAIYSDD